MTSDRKLLELACKAGGYERLDHGTGGIIIQDDDCHSVRWNPLTDDGDALRLAVKLGITMQQNFGGVLCYDNPDFADKSQEMIEVYEDKRPHPYVATRRAIVRAAAEIGRSME